LFGKFGWGEIDYHAIVRPNETRVDHRAFDTMSAFTNGLFGKSYEYGLGKWRGGQVNFYIDWYRFDPFQ
jgi:hypothetical protein